MGKKLNQNLWLPESVGKSSFRECPSAFSTMKPLFWDSINPATGLPYSWDDPNLRWGAILEPGDPGYVSSINPPPQKPKRMKRQAYYPTSAPEQVIWLDNFRTKLGDHAAVLALAAAIVTAAVADSRWVIYILGAWLPAVRAWTKSCTAAALQAQSSTGGALMSLPVFTAPALPTGVVPVNEGALDRIFALVQTIKDAKMYVESIGADLNILGAEDTGPDMDTIQPLIDALAQISSVKVGWDWGGNSAFLDMIELQVDRSDGKGYVFLANDTTPGYTDTTPFPATLTKWTYRAIYRVGEERVGVWSAPVSVTVGG